MVAFTSLVAVACAKPAADSYASSYGYGYNPGALPFQATPAAQFHAQDESGQYNYGYTSATSSKQETRTADGVVRGTYSYLDANGQLQTVNYISDILGFRTEATNLPEHKVEDPSIGYTAANVRAIPAQVVAHAPKKVEVQKPAVIAPTVAYSHLPYATNFGYFYNPSYYQLTPASPITTEVEKAALTKPVAYEAIIQQPINVQPVVQQQVAYQTPVQQVAYQAPVQGITYKQQVTYQAPVQEIKYQATVQQPVAAVASPVTYNTAPVAPVVQQTPVAAVASPVTYNTAPVAPVVQQTPVVPVATSPVTYNTAPVAPVVQQTPVVPASPIQTQYHAQDEYGQYKFGFADPNSARTEVKTADGTVRGHYNYVDDQGKIQTVHYIADHLGFRTVSSNLPVQTYDLPIAVVDTPEVIAAREEHERLFAEIQARDEELRNLQLLSVQQKVLPVEALPEPAIQAPAQEVPVVAVKANPAIVVEAEPELDIRSGAIPNVVAAVRADPIAVPVQQPAVPVAVPVAPTQTQYHAQDEAGQYNYGYSNKDSSKSEVRTSDGVVRGAYNYIDANGNIVTYSLVTNNLFIFHFSFIFIIYSLFSGIVSVRPSVRPKNKNKLT